MKTRTLVLLGAATVTFLVAGCTRDDGSADPPARVLVECSTDAGDGDPLACPAANDMGDDMGGIDIGSGDGGG